VSVGCDGDTAAFAVATLRRWWASVGQVAYPAAGRLLICADADGSNGYRLRLWKVLTTWCAIADRPASIMETAVRDDHDCDFKMGSHGLVSSYLYRHPPAQAGQADR
jgi:hypothetical protein